MKNVFKKVGLIAAALAAVLCLSSCGQISDAVSQAASAVMSSAGAEISSAISEGMEEFSDGMSELKEGMNELSDGLEAVSGGLETAGSAVSEKIENIKESIGSEISDSLENAKNDVSDEIKNAAGIISDELSEAVGSIAPATSASSDETTKEPAENKQYTFRNQKRFDEHYDKHGKEFGNITKEEYLELANELINSTSDRVLHKYSDDGDYMYFDQDTNYFLVLASDGYIRTFFIPTAGIKYWERQ